MHQCVFNTLYWYRAKSTLTSIPISDPKRFLALQDGYKQELMGDLRLEEASGLAARRQMLLENTRVDPDWALPQVKAMSCKLHRLTQRIRQPFGLTPSSSDMFPGSADDPSEEFAAGPVQALVKRLIQPTPSSIKTPPNKQPIKRKSDQLTPKVTPSTCKAKKKAKLHFRGDKKTQSKKPAQYRPELGSPIPFSPDTPSTSTAPLPTTPAPQGQAHSWLQGQAKTAGKKAAKSAAKSAGRGVLNWLGWTK